MKRFLRVHLSLWLLCLAAACSSSSGNATGDSAVGLDVVADVRVPGSDTAPVGPDSPAADASPSRADAAIPDLAEDSSATPGADVKADGPASDPPAADEKAATPDTAPPKADTAPDFVSPDGAAGADDAGCAQAAFTHLSPLELKTLLDGGEDPFLVNVKGDSIKNISGTDAVLANDVAGVEALVKHDLCANLVIYCRSGGTSQSVGSQLVAKGYRRVRDLAGGILAWQAAGYPTE